MTAELESTLTFDQFFAWLQDHLGCILRAGDSECVLMDHDDFHWSAYLTEDGVPVLELLFGKRLVGELVLSPREVSFVQAKPEPDAQEPGRYLFELMGGPPTDTYPLYHFVMAHGLDQPQHAVSLKH